MVMKKQQIISSITPSVRPSIHFQNPPNPFQGPGVAEANPAAVLSQGEVHHERVVSVAEILQFG